MASTGVSSTNELSKFPPVQVAFTFSGTNLELILDNNAFFTSSETMMYLTVSDGQITTSYTNVPGMGPNGVGIYYLPVNFSSNTVHNVTVAIKGNFAGINVPAGETISGITTSKPNLLIMEGDSYTEGYNPTVTIYGYQSYWFDLGVATGTFGAEHVCPAQRCQRYRFLRHQWREWRFTLLDAGSV